MIKIRLTSIFVDDQDTALQFYTSVLGFKKKDDVPVGEFKWVTVVSPDEPDGTQLLLEPNNNPAAGTFQKAIFEQGIAAAAFAVDDIHKEVERMNDMGVEFIMMPTKMPAETGEVTIAVFNDTCGNLIQLFQI